MARLHESIDLDGRDPGHCGYSLNCRRRCAAAAPRADSHPSVMELDSFCGRASNSAATVAMEAHIRGCERCTTIVLEIVRERLFQRVGWAPS